MLVPIETRYRGYRFRSRLEARWAVFLDEMGESWEYEREGFILPNGERYLPDFWLPGLHLWLEIKGQSPTEAEEQRCRLLRDHGDAAVALFSGLPLEYYGWLFCWDQGDSSAGSSEWQVLFRDDVQGRLCFGFGVETHKDLYADPAFEHLIELGEYSLHVEIAADRARAARFEYGEVGV